MLCIIQFIKTRVTPEGLRSRHLVFAFKILKLGEENETQVSYLPPKPSFHLPVFPRNITNMEAPVLPEIILYSNCKDYYFI